MTYKRSFHVVIDSESSPFEGADVLHAIRQAFPTVATAVSVEPASVHREVTALTVGDVVRFPADPNAPAGHPDGPSIGTHCPDCLPWTGHNSD